MTNTIETIANKIESIVAETATDHQKKIAVYYLMTAVVVYGLWAGVGLLMPDFYYDQPKERLLLTFTGFLLVIYLLSSPGPSTRKNSIILFLYVLVLHFHFLSLFVRAGGDEIYALGLLIFLIGASLLFLELRHYIGFFIIVIASYVPTFIALNLPSYRIVMLVAGMLTICIATSLLVFLRILMFDRFHTQQMAIAELERKLTEEKLLQQKEEAQHYKNARQLAEAANEAKNRYLAHMNHEMRTPLSGFMGFIDLMETTELDEDQQEFMHHMKQSAGHLLSIINNVLDHAKIEAGEMKLDHQPFLLKEEMQTTMAPLHSLALQQGLSLELTLGKDLPQKMVGDAQRLRQIILNLGGNAIKFTPKGQVNITLTCLETTRDHHSLQLVVEDTGPGMTEETLSKLFQPFYQADDGSNPQSKGTGLGLTITKELVELMGGRIQVKSTLGKGTRVEVHLMLMKG